MSKVFEDDPWLGGLVYELRVEPLMYAGRHSARKGKRWRVLFALAHDGFLRNFQDVIATMADRGAHVTVLLSRRHDTIRIEDYDVLHNPDYAIDIMAMGPSHLRSPARVERLRILRDILRYTSPVYAEAANLKERFSSQQEALISPERIARLERLAARLSPERRAAWHRRLEAMDQRIPPRGDFGQLLDAVQPHVLVVSPFVHFGSQEVDLVKAASARGIRTILAVASWDNLTNKGIIKAQPDIVAVWNQAMADEATSLHGVAPEAIRITGAPPFDRWFGRAPSRDRDEFLSSLGLNPGQKLVVWTCSSNSIAGGQEDLVINTWLKTLRTSAHPNLRKANVLIRPHPMASARWRKLAGDADPAPFGSAIIWPVSPKHPTSLSGGNDYYDTLFHADAVVGLNTSAMVEAAILSKPVFTFTDHEARERQTGNLHFAHLANSGYAILCQGLPELIERLGVRLEVKHHDTKDARRFVKEFIRPISSDIPASTVLAELIMSEAELAVTGQTRQRASWRLTQSKPLSEAPADA